MATTEIYTLSLHDALPISDRSLTAAPTRFASWATRQRCGATGLRMRCHPHPLATSDERFTTSATARDRKSTRLNSSHLVISYAVFCLKKKKKKTINT